MGKVPEAGDLQLDGTLVQVDKAAQGTALTATIEISGELAFEEGGGAVQARLSFVFEPPPAARRTGEGVTDRRGRHPRDPELVEARGYISKVIMSLRKVLPPMRTAGSSRSRRESSSCTGGRCRSRPAARRPAWGRSRSGPRRKMRRTPGCSTTTPRGGSISDIPRNWSSRSTSPVPWSSTTSARTGRRTR